MLAILKAKKEEIGARWIVFDGIDVLLTLLRTRSRRCARSIASATGWRRTQMSAIITAKIDGETARAG